MIATMDQEGFNNCTNQGAREPVCPKEFKMTYLALVNRDFLVAVATAGARRTTGGP
jgi:succinate dehydrogenase / fumarate reductase iron-sulfur subunit